MTRRDHLIVQSQRAVRTSLLGLFINVVLSIVKLVAGLLGHSYALIADAIESLADVFGSLVVWRGVSIAAKPADAEHPYGHGKAEALAALAVAMLIFAAGVGIAVEAVREILTPHHSPAPFTLWVLIAVVLVKETLFRLVRGVAHETDSGAVLVDAWHHRSDAITSAAAAVGITIALVGGPAYAPADDWAALVASTVILYNAVQLSRNPLAELMDAEPAEIITQVRELAAGVPGVLGVEKVFARKSGVGYWIDMHVEVDPQMTVRDSHRIAHEVKDHIRRGLPSVRDVLVHIEPFDPLRTAPTEPRP
ncbi:Ferrous-iron efflux pump FieF [Phycisphaerae bacterium RAS1]|nr:Ferrous-iron efflux pump FieF [Phycisphaerae bacterium RAS1]